MIYSKRKQKQYKTEIATQKFRTTLVFKNNWSQTQQSTTCAFSSIDEIGAPHVRQETNENMHTELQKMKQEDDETKQEDPCEKELNNKELQTERKEDEREDEHIDSWTKEGDTNYQQAEKKNEKKRVSSPRPRR